MASSLTRALTVLILVATAAAMCPSEASAQEQRSEPERIRVARELYSDAMKAFKAGEYEEAIEGFQAADALYPDPIFDYNIAVCWSALGHPMRALEAAERVADEDLPPENSVKNRARIVAFRRLQSARDLSRSLSLTPSGTTGSGPPRPRWSVLDSVAVGVAGAGVAGLGVTLYLSARVAALADEVESANGRGDFERAHDAEAKGRPLHTAGRVVGVASTLTLISGLTWLLVRRVGPSDAVSWSVMPGRHGVRAAVGLRF